MTLGIEGGGTKCECAIVGEDGQLLGVGRGGPVNANFVYLSELRGSLKEAIESAKRNAGDLETFSTQAMGLASPGRTVEIEQLVQELAGDAPLYAFDEHHAGLAACGVYEREGVSLIAGTGSSVRAYRDDQEALLGGWGAILGDEGSAYWLAVQGIRRALIEWEFERQLVPLLEATLDYFQVQEPRDLVPVVYRSGMPRHELALFAESVTQLAEEGDELAYRLCVGAGTHLGTLAFHAASRFFESQERFPLALSGSVFSSALIKEAAILRVSVDFPNAQIVEPIQRPAQGIAVLVWRELKGQ